MADPLTCLVTKFTFRGKIIEHGHMLWADETEPVQYAQQMGYGVEIMPCHQYDPPCPVRDGINKGMYQGQTRLYPKPEPRQQGE